MYAFLKFKNDDIISAKSLFYCFFVRTLWGERGILQKEYILYARENREKNGRPGLDEHSFS